MKRSSILFGTRLKSLRESRSLTQNDLATYLHIARTTITAYENDTNQPDFDTLINISNIFNVSLDYLLGRTNQKYNSSLLDESTNLLLEKIDLLDENTKNTILKIILLNETNRNLLLQMSELLSTYKILKDD